MAKFVIDGGAPLSGTIDVAANKNAVLPMMAAALLTDDDCTLLHVPRIADVDTMMQLLQELGATVGWVDAETLHLNCANVHSYHPPARLVERLRASIVLMGPLLARFGRARMHHPGGDAIGTRSIQTHLDALHMMGVEVTEGHDMYEARVTGPAQDISLFLDEASVTATENVLMFAAGRTAWTTIRNAASEPHVSNLAGMIKGMGAEVEGEGSNVLRIHGCSKLRGTSVPIWPDHVEAGTFAALAAATRASLTINNVVPEHLDLVVLTLQRMGVDLSLGCNSLTIHPSDLHAISKIQTGIWPAFPTDLASIFIVLATQAQGMTLVHDWMYEGRMFFIDKLVQMGARIVLADPHRAVVSGRSELRGRELFSPDIRAGIALVMAGLIAEGTTEIEHIELIDRGYERIDERLRSLGAHIHRVS